MGRRTDFRTALPAHRRRREAGNAMLELLLILPTYVMLLFILMTLSEYGQVASQTYQTARLLAWERRGPQDTPGTTDFAGRVWAESFRHFRRRIKVETAHTRLVVPLDESGAAGKGRSLGNGTLVLAGAHAYTYRALPNPLYRSGGNLDPLYQDDAAGANLAGIAWVALRGSDTPPARPSVPWLRRHYASVRVVYYPVDDLFGLRTRINTLHTVLRGATWNTGSHAPYRAAGRPPTMRDDNAYRWSGVLAIDDHNHQSEWMGNETDYEPDRP